MKRLGATWIALTLVGAAACASGEDPAATTLDPTFGDQGDDTTGPLPTTSSTTGDGDGDPTTGDGDGDATTTGDGDGDPGAVCGNGAIEGNEECDSGELGGATCQSQGFGGGGLTCNDDCTLNTDNCTNCGNDMVDEGEECDGADLGDAATCADLNLGAANEALGCTESCMYDFGECSGCGDGMVMPPEQCEPEGDLLDKADLNGATCMSLGFDDGILDCTPGCTFNTDGCYECGDAVQQGQEACDGADFGGASCADFDANNGDPFDTGSLSCNNDCSVDTSNCSLCGDGIITGAEVCDGGNLDGETCLTQGFDGGQLACNNTCTGFIDSACTDCGDGMIEGAEQCDFNNLGGETCQSQGFPGGGNLTCTLQCVLDTSDCADNFCGDGIVNGMDECDCGQQGVNCQASQLDNNTCQSLGFDGGTLACNSPNNCTYNTAGCYECGDNDVDPGEQCDGNNLAGQTCQSQGFPGGGNLACTNSCGFDTSACVNVQNPYTQCSVGQVGIFDNAQALSSFNVPENATIGDVNVYVDILHTWVSDLDITVIHGGQSVLLYDPNACSSNNIDATWDDEGAGNASTTCLGAPAAVLSPPNYFPLGSLANFDGLNMSGQWTLQVNDNAFGDTGTIVQWCITVSW